MANTGKALTNIAFRSKILAVIDKLKNQDKTALVRHVDDFEQLNQKTFETGMKALVEAIPEGGGGGGGSGVYEITLSISVDGSSGNMNISCDKTISEIRSKTDKALIFNFNFEVPEYKAIRQKLDMNYTEELFEDGEFSLIFTSDGKEMSQMSGQELGYLKGVLVVSGSIENGEDLWELQIVSVDSSNTHLEKDNDPFNYFNSRGTETSPRPYNIFEYADGGFASDVREYFNHLKQSFIHTSNDGANAITGLRESLEDANGYTYYNKAHCIWINFNSGLRSISFKGFATLMAYNFELNTIHYMDFAIDILKDIDSTPSIHRFIFRFIDDNSYNLVIKEMILNATEATYSNP